MGYLTWWNFPRKAWILILSEFIAIAFLSSWVYVQYLSDVYFQAYVDSLAPILVPALSVTFGVCSASLAAYLYLGMRRIRSIQAPESQSRRKAQSEKIHREVASVSHTDTKPSPGTQGKTRLRPLTVPRSHVQAETKHAKEREPSSEV